MLIRANFFHTTKVWLVGFSIRFLFANLSVRFRNLSHTDMLGSISLKNEFLNFITGENSPKDNYELDAALIKHKNRNGQRHIDEIPLNEWNGFFDDDGHIIKMHSIKKPNLCITCKYNNDPNEEFLFDMTRLDQQDEIEFSVMPLKVLVHR